MFNHENHDKGNKTILGRRGNLDGEGFVAAILEQPACAQFIATKVYDYFCQHMGTTDPADAVAVRRTVQSLAGTLRANSYELKPMLRRLLLPPRGLGLVCSALRRIDPASLPPC